MPRWLSRISGMEWWNGTLEWNGGMEHWNGMLEWLKLCIKLPKLLRVSGNTGST